MKDESYLTLFGRLNQVSCANGINQKIITSTKTAMHHHTEIEEEQSICQSLPCLDLVSFLLLNRIKPEVGGWCCLVGCVSLSLSCACRCVVVAVAVVCGRLSLSLSLSSFCLCLSVCLSPCVVVCCCSLLLLLLLLFVCVLCVVCGVCCDTLKNPRVCVDSKRPCVYRHHAHMSFKHVREVRGIHGDV